MIRAEHFYLHQKIILNDLKKAIMEFPYLQANWPSEIVKFTITRSGIEDMYKFGKEEDEERLENVRELVSIATKYDHLSGSEGIEKLIEEENEWKL